MNPAAARHRNASEPASSGERIEPRASDTELVERLARGDQWAKEALYRRYVKLVWMTALHMVGNRSDAQDVVQDTFVEALRDLPALRKHGALRPWILRICVHQAHRRFRRRKLLRRLGLDRQGDDAPLETLLHEGATAEQQLELRAVDRALRGASSGERFAWILRYVDGHTLEEVADVCGCSLATAKRRLSQAQALVREAFADEGARHVV
jgi:RNA polymerase sigma-70 factor (ECF subfamily)